MIRSSIIIVTYGQRALTEQCLRSLESCLGDRLGAEWELVLVDNDSPDDTPELLRMWSDRARVVLLDENRNFSGGCNAGATAARGEVLVFLNNDTEVTPGALERVAETALEPGVSVAGCRLLFPDRTLQHAGVAFLRGRALGGAPMPQHIFHHQDSGLSLAAGRYEVDSVTAACMAVRASTFHRVNGFDEGYRNGLEDIDLCLRIRLTGERVVYHGDATVIHHEGATRGRGTELFATAEKLAAMRHNDERFVARWSSALDQDDELAARLWDADLQNEPPARVVTTADVIVVGQPGGIGPQADEARAWLAAFAAQGLLPAAGDLPSPNVVARLSEPMATLLRDAQRRAPVPGAAYLHVPTGTYDALSEATPTIVRLAGVRTAVDLPEGAEIWACSPHLADELIASGLPAERIRVVAPPVQSPGPGPGGRGVLAILPASHERAAALVLDSLRGLPDSVAVRLLPTAHTRGLEAEVAAALPRAELLAPCSDEARFAALAADTDVVVATDPWDRFERRALVAAAAGATVVTVRPDGPASAVLGPSASGAPESLRDRVRAAVDAPHRREDQAQRVARACSPDNVSVGLALQRAA